MPLYTNWCKMQTQTWHFKRKLCLLDERDLNFKGVWGGFFFTAQTNIPISVLSSQLLVLYFNIHVGFLSPHSLYSIICRNNKPGLHSEGWSTVHHYITESACLTEFPTLSLYYQIHVKPKWKKGAFKSFPSSTSYILKLSSENINHFQLPGPLKKKKLK